MKILQLLLIFLVLSVTCIGQTSRELTEGDMLQIDKEVELKVERLRDSLEQANLNADEHYIEFVLDTFKIEEVQRLSLEIDFSTSGMLTSTFQAEKAYNHLLNKYYQILLKSLNEEEQKILKQSQSNWIAFRDSELELNAALMDDYYSGGGTIHNVLAAVRVLNLTRNRVIELFYYLGRKMD